MLNNLSRALALCSIMTTPAMADDWTIVRLRGTVLELVEGKWAPLRRGAVVPDDRVIRSLAGRATFTRDQETIELGENSMIQIMDRPGGDYTTVVDHQGAVSIEADVRNVEHFSVVTPYLAAVVKGTKFTVLTEQAGSTLQVTRGQVLMRDTAFGGELTISQGKQARTGSSPARIDPILPGESLAPSFLPEVAAEPEAQTAEDERTEAPHSLSGSGKAADRSRAPQTERETFPDFKPDPSPATPPGNQPNTPPDGGEDGDGDQDEDRGEEVDEEEAEDGGNEEQEDEEQEDEEQEEEEQEEEEEQGGNGKGEEQDEDEDEDEDEGGDEDEKEDKDDEDEDEDEDD